MIRAKRMRVEMIRVITEEATWLAFFLFLETRSLKTGIKAAERALTTKSWKIMSGRRKAAQ